MAAPSSNAGIPAIALAKYDELVRDASLQRRLTASEVETKMLQARERTSMMHRYNEMSDNHDMELVNKRMQIQNLQEQLQQLEQHKSSATTRCHALGKLLDFQAIV